MPTSSIGARHYLGTGICLGAYGRGWFDMPHKTYLLNHYQQVADLIGGRDSRVVGLDLVDRHGSFVS